MYTVMRPSKKLKALDAAVGQITKSYDSRVVIHLIFIGHVGLHIFYDLLQVPVWVDLRFRQIHR